MASLYNPPFGTLIFKSVGVAVHSLLKLQSRKCFQLVRAGLIVGVKEKLLLARGRRSFDLCCWTQAELLPPLRFLSSRDDKGGFCCNVGHLHSKSHSGLGKAKPGLNGQFAPLVWLVGR